MARSELPDPATLATLVSTVTETMCGVSFAPAAESERKPELCWRMATLPIPGQRPIRVVLSSSQPGATALGAALFGMPATDLDETMINDALCELLNMAAGQIKSALALDQALGLPKIVKNPDSVPQQDLVRREGVLLRSRGEIDLLIWVSEGIN
jgi:hypothetical protein